MPNPETPPSKPNLKVLTAEAATELARLEQSPGCLFALRDLGGMAIVAVTLPIRRATEYYYERQDFREQL